MTSGSTPSQGSSPADPATGGDAPPAAECDRTHRLHIVDGAGLTVGIGRFMSEARAVTDFAGNAIATPAGRHLDQGTGRRPARRRARRRPPHDEATMLDDDGHGGGSSDDTGAALREHEQRPVG